MVKRRRASRGSLKANMILHEALKIADSDGLGQLTVRRLAQALGVAPMSIYGHFKNKAEILDALLDVVIDEFEVTEHQEVSGEKWVLECFRRIRAALLAHPGVIPLLGTRSSVSATSIRVANEIVKTLQTMGLSDEESARQFYGMLTFTVGTAHVEQGFNQMVQDLPGSKGIPSLVNNLAENDYSSLLTMGPSLAAQANEAAYLKTLKALLSA